LDQESFDILLACFSAGRDEAGLQYEELRRRLVYYFIRKGSRYPEDLFDAAVDRAAEKLRKGEQIETGDPFKFVFGFARNIMREQWAKPVVEQVATDPPGKSTDADEELEAERLKSESRLDCLDECVSHYPPETRALVIDYYNDEAQSNKKNRMRIASELRIDLNTLRVRIHRIREKLEKCITDCVAASARAVK
jgi:DNA-directed RNA polymerase specialized sigma24 family protein